jgi:hypothetical protein
MLRVLVEVYASVEMFESGADPLSSYTIDHDDDGQRRTLGKQCRNAFEVGQMILTAGMVNQM